MWRAVVIAIGLALPVSSGVALAQEQDQTLADIRQELSVLFVEMQRLRQELNTTGAPSGSGGNGSLLSRVDALEQELRRLTGATEQLELRVNRVVSDGTNQIGDLEFRLCELEEDCDISTLGETSTLGGGDVAAPSLPATPSTAPSLAASEQSDFDRAMASYESGDYAAAATQFQTFSETYPGGALSAEAQFWTGEAEAAQGNWTLAARAYLASFSGSPDSARAPESLFRLGTSLHELGQTQEACVMFGEVEVRYPNANAVLDARAAQTRIGCN